MKKTNSEIKKIIKNALEEDIAGGDITTNSIIPENSVSKAEIVVKGKGVLAGLNIAKEVFKQLDNKVVFKKKAKDGSKVRKMQVVAEIKAKTRTILTGERVALNIMQRLSGIATLTSKFVQAAGKIKVLDTRKTTPGLRILEKYAVKAGGGVNHRMNLNDAILIKDNHIEAAGSITRAVELARKTGKKIEVEVKNIKEVREAIALNPDRILLDNMTISQMNKAIKIINNKAETEISGGVNLRRLKKLSTIKADYVSIGMLTHSVKSLDISLEIIG